VLLGQGDIHLQIAIDRLRNRHNLSVNGRGPPAAGFRIRRPSGAVRSSIPLKRQSGGHGQFADVTIEVKALPRGRVSRSPTASSRCDPRNYIPAVEEG